MTSDEIKLKFKFRNAELPWLEAGMQMLADSGNANLRIGSLSERVGISRTSFYHIFGSIPNFQLRLCEYWEYKSTVSLFNSLKGLDAPRARLIELVKGIKRDKLEGEVWTRLKQIGRNHPEIQKRLKGTESLRLRTVGNMIESLGYSEEDAKRKARVFMYYYFGRIMLEWSEGDDKIPDEKEVLDVFEAIGIKL